MRFLILLFLPIFLSTKVEGQDSTSFVVAACSSGVSIDRNVVIPGQTVNASRKKLTIPKKEYAIVISKEGYSHLLKSSISVKRVNKKLRWIYGSRMRATGSVSRTSVWPIEIVGAPQNQFPFILGDSILIAIKSNYVNTKTPYILEFKNIFEEVLHLDSIHSNWEAKSVKELVENAENALLLGVHASEVASSQHLIRRADDAAKQILNFDLVRTDISHDAAVLRLAIFQSRYFFYDQLFLLYQLDKLNYKPENSILQVYFNKLKEKYRFELFDFHK